MPSEVITINNQGNELSYLFVSVSGPYNFWWKSFRNLKRQVGKSFRSFYKK